MRDEQKKIKQYIFWGVVAILVLLSFFILKPFIIALVTAFILAYIMKPLENKLRKKLHPMLSSLVCIMLVAAILLVPLSILTTQVIQQASTTLENQNIESLFSSWSSQPLIKKMNLDFEMLREKAIKTIVDSLSAKLSALPSVIAALLVTLFGMYYLLRHWESCVVALTKYIPFNNKTQVVQELDKTTRAIVYGTFLIAVIEFIVAALGFYISGVQAYILLAVIIFIFAFVPGLGPIAVWAPLTIYYVISHDYVTAIGVATTGLIISIGIETIALPKIISKNANINPLIMLVGVLGGISVFGIFGFIIGPLVLAYTHRLLEQGLNRA